jgi:hypothetical protein
LEIHRCTVQLFHGSKIDWKTIASNSEEDPWERRLISQKPSLVSNHMMQRDKINENRIRKQGINVLLMDYPLKDNDTVKKLDLS